MLLMTLPSKLVSAQDEQFQPEKRIYLLDVTLSMQGYGDNEDIYDEVIDALIDDINKVTDPNVEIVVMPFQEGILAEHASKATTEGKTMLIQKIKEYKDTYKAVTYTNILVPFKYAVENYVDPKKSNIIMIMTDGKHNDKSSPKSLLIKEIKKWGTLTESVNAYAFYIILTTKADDQELNDLIEGTKGIDVIDNTGKKNFTVCQLTPQAEVAYNTKEDVNNGCQMQIRCNQDSYPDNLVVHIEAHNEYVDINSDQTIEDGKVKFDVNTLTSLSEMPEKFDLDIYLSLKNNNSSDRIFLVKENSKLTIINKKEKVLKIYVK